ncbi:MAG: histidine phosphatase family protein [Deltaproteobacteria bacterium]|jgi:broad specificity phosphatase PhoE|nr:histidine phosphatase family protein [Deltaproteobacteria bacterium]
METAISFVRHGEVFNPDNVFYGRLAGFGLSGKGKYQAVRAAEALNGSRLTAIFSSPLLRARQTAGELVKSNPHLKLRVSSLLAEVASPFDGRPAREVDNLNGDVYTGSGDRFEQPRDIVHRVRQFIRRSRRQYAGDHIAAVTHGDVIAFTVLWINRQPLIPAHKSRLAPFGVSDGYPALASVTTFTFRTELDDEIPAVAYLRPYTW